MICIDKLQKALANFLEIDLTTLPKIETILESKGYTAIQKGDEIKYLNNANFEKQALKAQEEPSATKEPEAKASEPNTPDPESQKKTLSPLQKALKEKSDAIAKEQENLAKREAEIKQRIDEYEAEKQRIHDEKKALAGLSVNERTLTKGEPIPAQDLEMPQTYININESQNIPLKFVKVKASDVKPNFTGNELQPRTEKNLLAIESIAGRNPSNPFDPKRIIGNGGFKDLPIITQDGSVIIGNHRAQGFKEFTQEARAAYNQAIKDHFNVNLADDELILRMPAKELSDKEMIDLAFASNFETTQNLGDKILASLGKYSKNIDNLKQRFFSSESLSELESKIAHALEPANNYPDKEATSMALFASLAKNSNNRTIANTLNETLKHLDLQQSDKLKDMYIKNAGSFYNIVNDTDLARLELRPYLLDALNGSAKALKASRAENFKRLIENINDILHTTDANGRNALKQMANENIYQDTISDILGASLARFARLENPATSLYEALKGTKDALKEALEPTLIKEGKPLKEADIYDFLELMIKQGEPSKESSQLIDLLPKLKEKEQAYNAFTKGEVAVQAETPALKEATPEVKAEPESKMEIPAPEVKAEPEPQVLKAETPEVKATEPEIKAEAKTEPESKSLFEAEPSAVKASEPEAKMETPTPEAKAEPKEITFIDESGDEQVIKKELVDKWLETFNLKSIDEAYIPNHSEAIKSALDNKEVRLTKGSLLKIIEKGREKYIPQVKQALENPDLILKDNSDYILAKQIKDDLFLASVGKDYETHITIISNAPKTNNTITNKLNNGASVVYKNAETLPTSQGISETKLEPISKNNSTTPTLKNQEAKDVLPANIGEIYDRILDDLKSTKLFLDYWRAANRWTGEKEAAALEKRIEKKLAKELEKLGLDPNEVAGYVSLRRDLRKHDNFEYDNNYLAKIEEKYKNFIERHPDFYQQLLKVERDPAQIQAMKAKKQADKAKAELAIAKEDLAEIETNYKGFIQEAKDPAERQRLEADLNDKRKHFNERIAECEAELKAATEIKAPEPEAKMETPAPEVKATEPEVQAQTPALKEATPEVKAVAQYEPDKKILDKSHKILESKQKALAKELKNLKGKLRATKDRIKRTGGSERDIRNARFLEDEHILSLEEVQAELKKYAVQVENGLLRESDKARFYGFSSKTELENLESHQELAKESREVLEKYYKITPIQEFGTNYAEFYKDGKGAIQKLIAEAKDYEARKASNTLTKAELAQGEYKGQVAGAFEKEGLGDIDLVWGEAKGAGKDAQGYGLAKIKEKHTNDFAKFVGDTQEQKLINGISEIMEKSQIVKDGDRATLQYEKDGDVFKIGLKQNWKGEKTNNHWIITAYNDERESIKTINSNAFTKGETLPLNSKDNPTIKEQTATKPEQKSLFDSENTTAKEPETSTLKTELESQAKTITPPSALNESLQEAYTIFKTHNKDAYNDKLFDKVIGVANDLQVRFWDQKNPVWIDGSYTYYLNRAMIDTKLLETKAYERASETILHELIHSTTSRAIHLFDNGKKEFLSKAQQDAITELKDIYKIIAEKNKNKVWKSYADAKSEVENNRKSGNYYGLKNEHEMLAELANKDFRDFLKKENLFTKIVNAIKKFFGINSEAGLTESNALKELETTLEKLMNYENPSYFTENANDFFSRNMIIDLTDYRKYIKDNYDNFKAYRKNGGASIDDESRKRKVFFYTNHAERISQNEKELESVFREIGIDAGITDAQALAQSPLGQKLGQRLKEWHEEETSGILNELKQKYKTIENKWVSAHAKDHKSPETKRLAQKYLVVKKAYENRQRRYTEEFFKLSKTLYALEPLLESGLYKELDKAYIDNLFSKLDSIFENKTLIYNKKPINSFFAREQVAKEVKALQEGQSALNKLEKKEATGIYNVTYNGKNASIIYKDLENIDEAIKYETGNRLKSILKDKDLIIRYMKE